LTLSLSLGIAFSALLCIFICSSTAFFHPGESAKVLSKNNETFASSLVGDAYNCFLFLFPEHLFFFFPFHVFPHRKEIHERTEIHEGTEDVIGHPQR